MEKSSENDLPRLQKVLAAAGVASRRACEALITAGRVTVNGRRITLLGTKVDPTKDDIRVDGDPIETPKETALLYIALNKPLGYVSTVTDPNASKTVIDLIANNISERVYPVGRLDVDTTGLLLLTNDGDFANRLTHPRYHVPKTYRVIARGFVDREAAKKLMDGIELPEGLTAPADAKYIDYDENTQCTTIEITLYEGRNRQVRRMMDAIGHPVRSLERIAFGNLKLGLLNPGTWRKLTPAEIKSLLNLAKPTPTPSRADRRPRTQDYAPRPKRPQTPPDPNAPKPEQDVPPRPRRGKGREGPVWLRYR